MLEKYEHYLFYIKKNSVHNEANIVIIYEKSVKIDRKLG